MSHQHAQGQAVPARLRGWQAYCDAGPAVAGQLAELTRAVASMPSGSPAVAMVARIAATFEPVPDMSIEQARARRVALLRTLAACLAHAPQGQAARRCLQRLAHSCRMFERLVDLYA